MYAQLCSSTNAIFTSVVVYSRTTPTTNDTNNHYGSEHAIIIDTIVCVAINVVDKKKKKTEHTRMYAQLCSLTNAIFTSVVVYSRTSVTQK